MKECNYDAIYPERVGAKKTISLKPIGMNQTELHVLSLRKEGERAVLFFSYETLVAAQIGYSRYRTEEYFSVTTSEHINRWLAGRDAEMIPQEKLELLLVVG